MALGFQIEFEFGNVGFCAFWFLFPKNDRRQRAVLLDMYKATQSHFNI